MPSDVMPNVVMLSVVMPSVVVPSVVVPSVVVPSVVMPYDPPINLIVRSQLTNEPNKARVFYCTRSERFARYKRSSLLGPFVS